MSPFNVFDPRTFTSSLYDSEAELSEHQLKNIMNYLDQAKQMVESSLNKKKQARLCTDEDKRKAAIDYLMTKATQMCIYSPFNQEYQTDVSIREVNSDPGKSITIFGTYETEPDTDTIGEYGSTITKTGRNSVNLVILLDDLNVRTKSCEPPFTLCIEGWRKEITIR